MRIRPRAARKSVMLAAALAVSLAAAACGSSSPTTSSAALAKAGASGTLNWEWELPTSWDPVTSSAGLGHARPRPGLRLDHHARPGREPRTRPGHVVDVRAGRQERDVHAAAGPEVHRRDAAERAGGEGEHRPRPDPAELQHRLGARRHLQGRREQPDQLHPGPEPGRLPAALPAGRQGRHDGEPEGLRHRGGREQPAHPAGRRGAVQADQLRPGLARRPGAQPRLLGRQPDPHRQLHRAGHHPARADPGRPGVRARSTWPTSPATRWRRPRPPGSRSR